MLTRRRDALVNQAPDRQKATKAEGSVPITSVEAGIPHDTLHKTPKETAAEESRFPTRAACSNREERPRGHSAGDAAHVTSRLKAHGERVHH